MPAFAGIQPHEYVLPRLGSIAAVATTAQNAEHFPSPQSFTSIVKPCLHVVKPFFEIRKMTSPAKY
jgi:hypothetical protein